MTITKQKMNVNSDAQDLKKPTQHVVTVNDVTGGNCRSQNSKIKKPERNVNYYNTLPLSNICYHIRKKYTSLQHECRF
jgi:hypothetical protein